MRVVLTLVSSDQGACELFQREKESLIPKSARDLPRVRSLGLDFITDIYNPAEDPRTIDNFLLTATRSSEAVALLVDKKLDSMLAQLIWWAKALKSARL